MLRTEAGFRMTRVPEDVYEEDYSWPEEPVATYAQAIDRLQEKWAGRVDIDLVWMGKRGPGRDARLAFLDHNRIELFARRIRSAAHASLFENVIDGACPIFGRHALWYPGSDTIVARIVGDYAGMINFLGRRIARLQPGAKVSRESSLGRDVLGLLQSEGVVITAEPQSSASNSGRTLRITNATRDLGGFYRNRYQYGSWLSLEMRNFGVTDVSAAESILTGHGSSFLYGITRSSGVSLRLWDSSSRLTIRNRRADRTIKFPTRRYEEIPAMLYAKASEAGRDSLERYLKYYQVLEYFMPRASEDLKLAQNANSMRKTLTPYPIGDENRDNLGIERNKLEAVIDAATTSVQVIGFLMGGPTLSVLSNARVLQDVHALPADPAGKIISGVIYQKEVAKRVYAIRCRIVHTKEEFNNGHVGPLLPYGREARDLEPDIGLVRFLAERALQHWSQPLS